MSKGQTLQDPFLNSLRKDRIPVSIFLVNGIKLQGQIESFDQYVVLLKNTVSQMVYKHAISTVVPARNPRSSTAPVASGMGSGYQGSGFERGGSIGSGFDQGGFGGTSRGGFNRGGFGAERGFGVERNFSQGRGFDRSGFVQERGFDDRGSFEPKVDLNDDEPSKDDFGGNNG